MALRDRFESEDACQVRKQLARILRSSLFTRAPSLSRFLSHLAELSLAGNANAITEYSLGVDVFDRGESFDPTTDTIVRVQARRLRSKLEQYYKTEGTEDPVVVELPKGQYTVVLRFAGAGSDSPASGSRAEGLHSFRVGLAPPPPLLLPCTSFVGREKELSDVKRLLRSEHSRLLILTGPGGSGKTRLALQVAAGIRTAFPGGIYTISLASVLDPETVASTIAQAVGLRHTGGRPLSEALREFLAISVETPTLLLLDNFEQVADAAPLLTVLLAGCPQLRMIVTSRFLLDVLGEHVYPVPPLPKPDAAQTASVEELARNAAVTLFVERATAVNSEFTVTEDSARHVAEICARLDCLPLAIELAAARTKVLSPAAMLLRLDNPLDLLSSGYRDLPLRQQTLRRTIDWSHSFLSASEQMLFRRLAVLVGGCTLESAEAVCNPNRDLEIRVIDGILSLVNKNLIQREEQQNLEVRFAMLRTIQEYALEKLATSGELDFTRRAHAAYCLVLAEEGATQITEDDRARWLSLCGAEHDNLCHALDWLIKTNNGPWALRFGTALFAFWQRREHFAEGRQRLEAILRLKTAASPTPERARTAWYAAILAYQQGDFTGAILVQRESLRVYTELNDQKGIAGQLCYVGDDLRQAGNIAEAREYFERSVAACRELGDRGAVAMAANNFAEFLTEQREYSQARSLLAEALLIFRQLGNQSSAAWSLNHLADIALHQKDFGEAHRLYREAYDLFRSVGDRWGIARSYADLGRLASEQNNQDGARSLFEQALKAFLGLGHSRGLAMVLEGLARSAVREGDFDRALTLAAAAEGLRQRVGAPKRTLERAALDDALQPARDHTAEAHVDAIWEVGLHMSLEEAIRYALRQKPAPPVTVPRS
jgi:predicted ATPase